MRNIPIIRYEHIRDIGDSHSVRVREFERQIAYFKSSHYIFLSLDEYSELKSSVLDKKAVLLIFEGAWRDFYENAYPIFKRFGAKAGIFLTTEWVQESSKQEALDSQNPSVYLAHDKTLLALEQNPRAYVCTWSELESTKDLISFGSLTHTYQLSNFVSKPWHDDLQLSKELIAKNLGIDTTHLLWPRGQWDMSLLRTAKKLGFSSFYTYESGQNLQSEDLERNKTFLATNSLFELKKELFVCSNTLTYKLLHFLL
ncbi:MAG: polysaccharide deacetylase family protein [Helicobacter sp.]|nr:polysaccharide deacetylase family protein [Helicobacter sp.]